MAKEAGAGAHQSKHGLMSDAPPHAATKSQHMDVITIHDVPFACATKTFLRCSLSAP